MAAKKKANKGNFKADWLQATALITVWLLELIYRLKFGKYEIIKIFIWGDFCSSYWPTDGFVYFKIKKVEGYIKKKKMPDADSHGDRHIQTKGPHKWS